MPRTIGHSVTSRGRATADVWTSRDASRMIRRHPYVERREATMHDNEFEVLLPPKPAKKRPFTMYMPPDLMAQLQSLSTETGAPVAEIVRRAIATMLAERQTAGA